MERDLIIAVDIETTGTDPTRHAVTEIALVTAWGERFHEYVMPGSAPWDPWSLRNTAYGREGVSAGSPASTDLAVHEWLAQAYAIEQAGNLTALGRNVGSFDLAFIARYLPMTRAWFGYRTIDLATLTTWADMVDPRPDGQKWRGYCHDVAVQATGVEGKHNALWDAKAAWTALDVMADPTYGPRIGGTE